MDIPKALALLKRLLGDVPRLKSLADNPKNEELPAWDNEVKRIIRETFGRDSKESVSYGSITVLKRVKTQADKEKAYLDYVSQQEQALKNIIQEYDLPTEVETPSDDRGNMKAALEHFHEGFIRYTKLVMAKRIGSLTSEQESELQTLSVPLQREYGVLKEVIEKYGGSSVLLLQGGNYKYEAFSSVFNYTIFSPSALQAVVDTAIATLNMAIGKLGEPVETGKLPREAVFQSGKPYDAYVTNKKIIAAATKTLMIVDRYVDDTLLTLLGNVQPNARIKILTEKMTGDFELAGKKLKEQRQKDQQGSLEVRKSGKIHDRFVFVDDKIFHVGASIKDAGDRMYFMSEVERPDIKSKLIRMISDYWDKADVIL